MFFLDVFKGHFSIYGVFTLHDDTETDTETYKNDLSRIVWR